MNGPIESHKCSVSAWCRTLFAGLFAAGTLSSQAATIIDNFNAQIPGGGSPTFATHYIFVGSPYSSPIPGTFAGECFPEGRIAIVTSSADVHGLWAVGPTYTPEGSGCFLAVNGYISKGCKVYQRSGLPVTAGATYAFQADLTSLFNEAPAKLQLSIEFFDAANVLIGGITAPTVSPVFGAGWQTTVLPGVAPGGAVRATITLNNLETAASGNDFGLDNVGFTMTGSNCVVVAGCQPGTNPSGKNIPKAGNNPKSGQNPDGFYKLLGGATCAAPASLQIFVKDSASAFIAGPFKVGDTVKITQAPGVTPNWKKMAGVVVAHIQLKGDALVIAYDPATQTFSAPHSCLVPPKPK